MGQEIQKLPELDQRINQLEMSDLRDLLKLVEKSKKPSRSAILLPLSNRQKSWMRRRHKRVVKVNF